MDFLNFLYIAGRNERTTFGLAIWWGDEYIPGFLFAIRLQSRLTNTTGQQDKQLVFYYKFSIGYGHTNQGIPATLPGSIVIGKYTSNTKLQ